MADEKNPTALIDMDFDEVSVVGIPANQESDIVLFKSHRANGIVTRKGHAGVIARARRELARGRRSNT